jgi:LmeA-like phospholipid-binding
VSDYQPRAQGGWPAQPPSNQPLNGQPPNGGPDDSTRAYQRGGYGPGSYGPPAQPGGTAGRRRRRRRWPIVLVIVLVLLLAIAAIGDQVAKSYAQNRIAGQIRTNANMSTRPSVTIEGWPFLTQIAARDLQAVDIKADNVTTAGGKLPVSFTARATGVHLNSSFNGATVDHISGQATISYQSLDSYIGQAIGLPGLTAVTFTADPAAGPNVVKADFGVGSVDATVLKTGANQITIRFGSLSGIASLLGGSGSLQPQVIDIPRLPAGLVLGSPTANSQGIVIPASASNTTLTQ